MGYLTLEAPSEASLWSLDRASSRFSFPFFVFKPPPPPPKKKKKGNLNLVLKLYTLPHLHPKPINFIN